MFLFGGGGQQQANQTPQVSGLQVQTSAYGKVIPYVCGAMRVPPNLLWYGDFSATAHRNASGGKGGVGGGGGGKNGGGSIYYTYATSFVYGLCEGEIAGIGKVWKDKNQTTAAEQGFTVGVGDYPQAVWGYLETNHGYLYESRTIPAAPGPYTLQANYHSPFLVDNGVFSEIEMAAMTSPPSANKYSTSNQGKTYTFNAADAGKHVRLISDLDPIARPKAPVLNQVAGGALAGATYWVGVTYVTADGETTRSALSSFAVSTNFLLTVERPANVPGVTGWNVYVGTSSANMTRQNGGTPIDLTSDWTLPVSGLVTGVKAPTINSTGGYISLDTTIPASAPYVVNWDRQADSVFLRNVLFTKVVGAPALNQYSVDTSGVYTFNSGNDEDVVTISYSAGNQNPPFQAIGYNGVAWVAASSYALGQSPNLGNHNFEVLGRHYQSVGSLPDADPSLVVVDLLSDPTFGAGFPSGKIGDLTVYQDYCCAAGLLLSFALTSEGPAADILEEIATVTNSGWVWSEATLKLIPYGDEDLTGNGHTYTAPSAPLFDLDDDDFLDSGDDDPVRLKRKRPTDAINWLQMEFKDRAFDYNTGIAEDKNQAFIDLYGLRPEPDDVSTTHLFADATAAQTAVQLILQRQLILNTYEFDTDYRYIVLDPMDIITITDERLGLDRQWVRVKEMRENSDMTISFVVEEYLTGIASTPVYSFQESGGYSVNYNEDAGDVNPPIIFEAPPQIATQNGLETWMAVSGGNNWGGCDIWLSADGDTYAFIGRVSGASRMGLLTAVLLEGDDPDTAHTLSVDLSQSFGNLISGTEQDADQGNTLCYVDGELISYATANLTETYEYDLSYLRRGMYGTTIAEHAAGTQFARLDQQVFVYPYDKSQIGQTVFIKFLSFNKFGGGLQSLSDVDPVAHTIVGPPLPANVQGFTVQQNGGTVSAVWQQIVPDFALKGYNISYGPQGGTFEASQFLTQADRGTEMTNASVPPGDWTFYIVAVDIADQQSLIPGEFDLTVTNQNQVLSTATYAPDWVQNASVPVSNLYKHWTGKLVPESENLASTYVPLSPPSAPVLSEQAGGSLTSDEYFVAITYVTDGGETLVSTEDSFTVSDNYLLVVDSPAASGNAVGWNVYVGTTTGVYTKQNTDLLGIGSTWKLPLTGLIAGASPPSLNTTGWEVFDTFVPDPYPATTYTAPDIDEGFVATFRVWATPTFALGPGETGSPIVGFNLAYDDAPFGGVYDFVPWTIGQVTAEYLAGQIAYNPVAGSVAYISDLTFTIDAPVETGTITALVVGSGGTTITFADYPQLKSNYHLPPSVQVTVASGTGTSGVAINITTTGAEIHLYNGTVGVAGTASVTVTGV